MEMQAWLDCPIARATRGLSRPSLDARSLGQTKPTLAVEVGGKKRRLPAHVSPACATLTRGRRLPSLDARTQKPTRPSL